MNSGLTDQKINLIGMAMPDLETFFNKTGEPRYRAKQVFRWMYNKQVNSFGEMQNIPKRLRSTLDKDVTLHSLGMLNVIESSDESVSKFLFKLQSGELVESVLMKDEYRTTVCLSTQVGCNLGCKFCATASMGFQKNLSVGEILDQFLLIQKQISRRITNVVFMGMGEPFLNYKKVIQAADLLNDPEGISLGARRITISTVGIIPRILQFTDEQKRYKLAISLNGTTQEQRVSTMPVANSYPLEELMESARYNFNQSRRYLTFEYVLLQGINDDPTDAERLIKLIGKLPCKVNVIPYNEIGGEFHRPTDIRIKAFIETLNSAPFTVTIRWSKGTKIRAGCGQLAILSREKTG